MADCVQLTKAQHDELLTWLRMISGMASRIYADNSDEEARPLNDLAWTAAEIGSCEYACEQILEEATHVLTETGTSAVTFTAPEGDDPHAAVD